MSEFSILQSNLQTRIKSRSMGAEAHRCLCARAFHDHSRSRFDRLAVLADRNKPRRRRHPGVSEPCWRPADVSRCPRSHIPLFHPDEIAGRCRNRGHVPRVSRAGFGHAENHHRGTAPLVVQSSVFQAEMKFNAQFRLDRQCRVSASPAERASRLDRRDVIRRSRYLVRVRSRDRLSAHSISATRCLLTRAVAVFTACSTTHFQSTAAWPSSLPSHTSSAPEPEICESLFEFMRGLSRSFRARHR